MSLLRSSSCRVTVGDRSALTAGRRVPLLACPAVPFGVHFGNESPLVVRGVLTESRSANCRVLRLAETGWAPDLPRVMPPHFGRCESNSTAGQTSSGTRRFHAVAIRERRPGDSAAFSITPVEIAVESASSPDENP